MQEAANDLLNVEEGAVGEEHGGGALLDEGLPAGEEQGGACMEDCLPDGGPGVPGTAFRDPSSADAGVGEDGGAILNGEEQGGAWTGEGERGLKAEQTLLGSASRSGPSLGLEDSKEGLEDGQLPEGKPGLTRLVQVCEPCWSGSLEPIERTD